jgi:hypothetical protein
MRTVGEDDILQKNTKNCSTEAAADTLSGLSLKIATSCKCQSPAVFSQPRPLTRKQCCPPPPLWFQGGRGAHSLAGEGAGGANSDEGTDSLHCKC